MSVIASHFSAERELGQAMHRKVMDYFRQYLIVGGMPQAVKEYASTRDFNEVDSIKRDILTLYRNDITKHANGQELKVRAIFDEIPAQLQKHEKKFNLATLQRTARMRDYEDALFWLADAMIINACYNATEPSIGLKLNRDRLSLKCYMGDTGLLISHSFDEDGLLSEELYKKLLFGKLEVNQGMIMENIVAQMFTAASHSLYFYSNSSREDRESRMEIDFLIAKNKISTRHNISPVEVKSGKNYTLSSLQKFRKKYHAQLHTPYVLHTGDVRKDKGIVFLPAYMAPFL
jgi:predicted AAA+ superfamily ATPase